MRRKYRITLLLGETSTTMQTAVNLVTDLVGVKHVSADPFFDSSAYVMVDDEDINTVDLLLQERDVQLVLQFEVPK